MFNFDNCEKWIRISSLSCIQRETYNTNIQYDVIKYIVPNVDRISRIEREDKIINGIRFVIRPRLKIILSSTNPSNSIKFSISNSQYQRRIIQSIPKLKIWNNPFEQILASSIQPPPGTKKEDSVVISSLARAGPLLEDSVGRREGARGLGPRQRFTCRPRYEALFVGRSTSIPRRVFEAEPRPLAGPRGPSFQASVSPSRARAANVSRPVIDTYIKREWCMHLDG